MNIEKHKHEKASNSTVIMHIIAIVSCLIAVVVISFAIYYGSDELNIKTGKEKEEEKVILKKEELKRDLLERLENITYTYGENHIKKENETKSLVDIMYYEKKEEENAYSINVYVPYINIDSEVVKKFKNKMENTYIKKIQDIKEKNSKTIMSTQYLAILQDNILSIIVSTDLKEDTTSQRLLIETFTYDLINDKEISLQEYLSKNSKYNQKEITQEVKKYVLEQKEKNSTLEEAGFELYKRDENSKMYHVENTEYFFVDENAIYLIYPYGNKNKTREVDIIPILKLDT